MKGEQVDKIIAILKEDLEDLQKSGMLVEVVFLNGIKHAINVIRNYNENSTGKEINIFKKEIE